MTRRHRIAAAALVALSVLGAAAPAAATPAAPWAAIAAPPDLPANPEAQALIDAEPSVLQARHALDAARQRARMLDAGPYEWTARGSFQRRSYRSGEPATGDWSAGVERTLRIGGKAGLDRQIGEALVRQAQARLGEARHEAARTLLALWLDRLAAERTQAQWQAQLELAEANLKAAGSRRKAGDASLLEQNTARADLAEVQRQLSLAASDAAKAAARLRARFPAITPAGPALSEPAPLGPEGPLWRERILAESDSLRIVQAQLRQAELLADRAQAERTPDPTVGVHGGREQAGAERVVGLTFSMPIGGSWRESQQREALAQAQAARAAVDAQRRDLEAEIGERLADAAGSLERWRFAEAAVEATRDNARLTQRAYALGEADLQTLLLARRQSLDAALGAVQARVDALRSRYRLLIDAHLIWGLADD